MPIRLLIDALKERLEDLMGDRYYSPGVGTAAFYGSLWAIYPLFVLVYYGVRYLWWAGEIYFDDAYHVAFPFWMGGLGFTLLALIALIAAWDMFVGKRGVPEYIEWILSRRDFLNKVPVLGAITWALSLPFKILEWDIAQDRALKEGKYAIPGESLMSSYVFRAVLINGIILLGQNMDPVSESFYFYNLQAREAVEKLGDSVRSWAGKHDSLPVSEHQLASLVRDTFNGQPKTFYKYGQEGTTTFFQVKYVANATGPYFGTTPDLEPLVLFCAFDRDHKRFWLTGTTLDRPVGRRGTPILYPNNKTIMVYEVELD